MNQGREIRPSPGGESRTTRFAGKIGLHNSPSQETNQIAGRVLGRLGINSIAASPSLPAIYKAKKKLREFERPS